LRDDKYLETELYPSALATGEAQLKNPVKPIREVKMLSYKKFLLLIITLILPALLYSQPITPVWTRTYNDPCATQAHEFPSGLAVDNSGITYITMSAINESWRKWRTISYYGSGNLRWQDSISSTHGYCEPSGIAINDDLSIEQRLWRMESDRRVASKDSRPTRDGQFPQYYTLDDEGKTRESSAGNPE
jgi:hypothetical protein